MKPQKMYKILRIKKEEVCQVTPTEPMLTNEWADALPVGVLPVLITFIHISVIKTFHQEDEGMWSPYSLTRC